MTKKRMQIQRRPQSELERENVALRRAYATLADRVRQAAEISSMASVFMQTILLIQQATLNQDGQTRAALFQKYSGSLYAQAKQWLEAVMKMTGGNLPPEALEIRDMARDYEHALTAARVRNDLEPLRELISRSPFETTRIFREIAENAIRGSRPRSIQTRILGELAYKHHQTRGNRIEWAKKILAELTARSDAADWGEKIARLDEAIAHSDPDAAWDAFKYAYREEKRRQEKRVDKF